MIIRCVFSFYLVHIVHFWYCFFLLKSSVHGDIHGFTYIKCQCLIALFMVECLIELFNVECLIGLLYYECLIGVFNIECLIELLKLMLNV